MKNALVLGGGGAKGAYEIGVWKAMRDTNIHIHIVTGTSIGAVNGALITQGSYERAMYFWNHMRYDYFLGKDFLSKESGEILNIIFERKLINMGRLKKLLDECIDEDMVRKSGILFGMMIVNKDKFMPKKVYLDEIPYGSLNDYILASSTLYPFVKAKDIGNSKYIDGGYYDNLPIDMAAKKGADRIMAVDLKAPGFIKKCSLKVKRKVTYIYPLWDLGIIIDLDEDRINNNIKLGYLDCMKAMGIYEGRKFTFLKGETEKFKTSLFKMDNLCVKNEKKISYEALKKNISLLTAESMAELYKMNHLKIYKYDEFMEEIREKYKI